MVVDPFRVKKKCECSSPLGGSSNRKDCEIQRKNTIALSIFSPSVDVFINSFILAFELPSWYFCEDPKGFQVKQAFVNSLKAVLLKKTVV